MYVNIFSMGYEHESYLTFIDHGIVKIYRLLVILHTLGQFENTAS